ncbi:hypothetical protein WR43_09540 [Mycolicibacter arupensis]|jgi:hypothetical protein|nr:hypothetical protein WR43_09540 [Mycolicibacter arupensis]OQZ91339.1 hypothetical protein BST15_20080 [Mycolicibacter arupensis]
MAWWPETPATTTPRVASLIDRQAGALADIRRFLGTVDAKPWAGGIDLQLSGEKSCAAVIAAILDR